MSGNIDFSGIAALALSQSRSLVPQWLPAGRLRGHEFVCGGLNGEPGESLSINLTKGVWSDFANGAKGGDLISLYAAVYRKSQAEAARELSAQLGGVGEARPGAIAPAVAREVHSSEWAPIIPVPAHAAPHPVAHFKHGKAVHIARYLTRDGGLIGLILRCEPEGGKQILPLAFCERSDGRQEWRWLSQGKPRSLYGAELLGRGWRILIVEGETTADAARRLLADYQITVITWPGGAQAAQYADWSMLAGCDCIIWPDADPAGFNAAAQITIQIRHHGATVRTVELPPDVPKGWDLGDGEREGWSGDQVMGYVDPREPEPEMEPDYDYGEPDYEPEEAAQADFRALGHDHGKFYFLTMGGGQVRELSSRDLHSVSCLCELAPLRHWEMNYPGKGDAGFNVRAAGDALTRMCYKVGIYDPERIRGLGAWLDDGRTVLHIGDRAIVDGTESSIIIPKSRYIYEHSVHLDMDLGEPLSNAEANMLRELCVAAPWERPNHMGQLLAGWCVIAPVCGAMPWRPHLWITSEGGGGKTWCLDNIVKPIVGALALNVQSKTTEAALRQALGCDARPVIFDEVETQNETDRARVQYVLDIARQASSEEGAPILKGTSGGKVNRFRIRSCFAFSSINVGMSQSADESRTVVLTLSPDPDPARRNAAFAKLKEIHAKTMIPGFAGRLLARTLSLLPVIRANAVIFAEAIARSGKPRRLGDTYGVLMAGAWSLRSRAVATVEEADRMVLETAWVKDAVAKTEVEPEWSKAFTTLLQHRARVVNFQGRADDIPVGDLIRSTFGGVEEGTIGPSDAKIALNRMGMRVHDGYLQVGNNSQACAGIFAKTPWATSWASTLARMPGSERNTTSARLAGHLTKVFSLPLTGVE